MTARRAVDGKHTHKRVLRSSAETRHGQALRVVLAARAFTVFVPNRGLCRLLAMVVAFHRLLSLFSLAAAISWIRSWQAGHTGTRSISRSFPRFLYVR